MNTETVLMLKSVEVVTNADTSTVRKVATFEQQVESRIRKGVFRRVIGSGATIVSFFPNRYNNIGDEVPNADYAEIDSFIGDEVPGLEVHRISTSNFSFPTDVAGSEPRTSVIVVTMNNGNADRAALYQLRGTGASFTGTSGDELIATTPSQQDAKVADAKKRSADLKASGNLNNDFVATPLSKELTKLEQLEAAFNIATEKLAKAVTPGQKVKAQAQLTLATEALDAA